MDVSIKSRYMVPQTFVQWLDYLKRVKALQKWDRRKCYC